MVRPTKLPRQFGRYLLTELVASGGMAEIYKASIQGADGFEKDLVIKCILPMWSGQHEFIEMFIDEAKIVAQLNHPNIVQVYELNQVEGVYYIAMEYVDGLDLRSLQTLLVKQGRNILPEIATYIISEALLGLGHAHEKKNKLNQPLHIIHRDISPQNILLSHLGEVKVGDFGIALALERGHETQTGVLKGKYAYMSPEQAEGANLDARADLFSLGIVFYELLFQEKPFGSGNGLAVLNRAKNGVIPWPKSFSRLPILLQNTLKRALEPNRDQRYRSTEEFRKDLQRIYHVTREDCRSFLESMQHSKVPILSTPDAVTTALPDPQTELLSAATRTVFLAETEHIFVEKKSPEIFNQQTPKGFKITPRGWIGALVGLGILSLSGLSFFYSNHSTSNSTSVPSEVVVEEEEDLTQKQRLDSMQQPLIVRPTLVSEPAKEKPKLGGISINAVPWGMVSISGVANQVETPFRKQGLKPGQYVIRVMHGPTQQSSKGTVVVSDGRTSKCYVNFEKSSQLICQ
ncbi:MAG: serine/threonine protein kinase [Deltaproteobacteria bacterium]|nr:serine/threonine protein kinase [Deltaproteobacteria bacterium]